MRILIFILTVFFIQLSFTRPASAYLDPGTGSYIFQLLVAGVFGGIFAFKIFWSKIKKIVYAADDEKFGFSKYEKILKDNSLSILHPKLEIEKNILASEASELLTSFFREKRKQKY